MDYEEFLKSKGLDFEIMYFPSPVKTVSQAKEMSGLPEEKIVKTIILKGKKNYALIISGKKKADIRALKSFDSEIRLASPEEVMEITGFQPGAVPPIMDGDIIFMIDRDLLNQEYVVAGGGKENALVKLKVSDIMSAIKPNVIEI